MFYYWVTHYAHINMDLSLPRILKIKIIENIILFYIYISKHRASKDKQGFDIVTVKEIMLNPIN